MGYQKVKKPKFYIDYLSFLYVNRRDDLFNEDTSYTGGYDKGKHSDLFFLNPVGIVENTRNDLGSFFVNKVESDPFPPIRMNFAGLLNHNFQHTHTKIWTKEGDGTNDSLEFDTDKSVNIIYSSTAEAETILHNGFSLGVLNSTLEINPMTEFGVQIDATHNIGKRYLGSLIIGHTWSPPHNPNLSYSHKRSYDGIKEKEGKGGNSLANINYLKNNWCNHNEFDLWNYNFTGEVTEENYLTEDINLNLGRTSKREWRLQWDDITDEDLFVQVEQSNNSELFDFGAVVDNPFLLDSFISRVWVPTLGGKLPFIFQPDDTNKNPDQFAICQIKEKSLKITPKAPNLYNFSITIQEVC